VGLLSTMSVARTWATSFGMIQSVLSDARLVNCGEQSLGISGYEPDR
jgi:hypothetical protein